jgi:hypothetical protein
LDGFGFSGNRSGLWLLKIRANQLTEIGIEILFSLLDDVRGNPIDCLLLSRYWSLPLN